MNVYILVLHGPHGAMAWAQWPRSEFAAADRFSPRNITTTALRDW